MKKSDAKAAIEAILFTLGEAIELESLAAALDVPENQLQTLMDELIEEYKDDLSIPLYEESKKQIDNATSDEVLNEKSSRRIVKKQ